ncbi:respiratory nitrate reductase subunit gamma [Streptomyces radiopugnans]|uniref:respiratory nitrate reductase subunit gamma n=1 Tax=Streptomyces radiopugnans TaxID=403935 RepID=UPI003F19AD9B
MFAAGDPVFSATTRNDKPMYLILTAAPAPAPAPAPGLAPRWPPTSSTRATAFAVRPFTRLVHMLTAPLGYLTRPYIVYRSRGHAAGLACPRRGWERVR